MVREIGVPLLFGTDEIERGSPRPLLQLGVHLDPGGATAAVYRKIQLVPFGEFVPFKSLLFFVEPLVGRSASSRPAGGDDAADGRAHGADGDLLRGGLSVADPRGVRRAASC